MRSIGMFVATTIMHEERNVEFVKKGNLKIGATPPSPTSSDRSDSDSSKERKSQDGIAKNGKTRRVESRHGLAVHTEVRHLENVCYRNFKLDRRRPVRPDQKRMMPLLWL